MAHIIRRVSIKDVENFISMLANIYDESPYTHQENMILASHRLVNNYKEYITSPHKVIFVAESDEQLVGFAFVNINTFTTH